MLRHRKRVTVSYLSVYAAIILLHFSLPAHAQPWPASDPNNTGGWIANSTYSDEFNGTSLDSTKWNNYHTYWGGRAVGYFDTHNVSVSGGYLRIKTIDQNYVKNPSFEKNPSSPQDWTGFGAGTKSLTLDNTPAGQIALERHRDLHGVKIVGGVGGVQQTVTGLTQNTQYKFSGTARVSAAGVTATLGVKSTSGTVITSKSVTATSFPPATGHSANLTFTTGAGVTSVIVYVQNSGTSGTVWADEISLCRKTLANGFVMHDDTYFTTGCVQSKTKAPAGYYECRMKSANACHTSSFWFQAGPNGEGWSEIDVIEAVGNSIRFPWRSSQMPTNTRYYPFGWAQDITTDWAYTLPSGTTASAFHTYGVEWDAATIKYYFDGAMVRQIQIPSNGSWPPFQLDQYLFFDTEIFTGDGIPLDGTNSEFQIDYVRGWNKSLVPDAIYEIYPVHAQNKRLDVSGVSTSPGANVHIWDDLNAANQRWKAIDMGGGAFQLQPQHATGQRLEANDSGLNANVRQNTASPSSLAQRWHLIPIGMGAAEVISGNALADGAWQKRLEAAGGASGNGTNVRLGDDIDLGHQRWVFQRQP